MEEIKKYPLRTPQEKQQLRKQRYLRMKNAEKKLDIAMKALNLYCDEWNGEFYCGHIAEQALEQIEAI